jgi:hypothetical protein
MRFRIVVAQAALQKQSRDAALIGGHEVGRPEPNRQRRFCIMQDRPSGLRPLSLDTREEFRVKRELQIGLVPARAYADRLMGCRRNCKSRRT